MTTYENCAAVWVAGGGDYARDAEQSRNSIRYYMPDIRCILASDSLSYADDRWDGLLELPLRDLNEMWYLESCRWYGEVLGMLANNYARLLFLDTDTLCCAPMYGVFDLLDKFDLVGTHGVARHTTKTVTPLPDAFPELEIGMLAVRTNPPIGRLFTQWRNLYEARPEVYGNNDQGPFREALWLNNEVRFYVATPEYHCRAGFGAWVAGKVRLVHSRAKLQEIAEEINETGGMRLYRPGGIMWKAGHGAWTR
jgi:hypothetical protein